MHSDKFPATTAFNIVMASAVTIVLTPAILTRYYENPELKPGGKKNRKPEQQLQETCNFTCRKSIAMPIAFLFIIFTFLFTSVFAQTIKGVINPQVVESAAYDVAYATVPYTILKPSMPLSSLPAKKITDKFVLTNRIDTLGV